MSIFCSYSSSFRLFVLISWDLKAFSSWFCLISSANFEFCILYSIFSNFAIRYLVFNLVAWCSNFCFYSFFYASFFFISSGSIFFSLFSIIFYSSRDISDLRNWICKSLEFLYSVISLSFWRMSSSTFSAVSFDPWRLLFWCILVSVL